MHVPAKLVAQWGQLDKKTTCNSLTVPHPVVPPLPALTLQPPPSSHSHPVKMKVRTCHSSANPLSWLRCQRKSQRPCCDLQGPAWATSSPPTVPSDHLIPAAPAVFQHAEHAPASGLGIALAPARPPSPRYPRGQPPWLSCCPPHIQGSPWLLT